jgi:PAS domain S-box-containing protein
MSRNDPDLQLAQEHFRLAVEACPLGMVMVAATGRIVMVNSATERMFGYSRNELIGQTVELLVPRTSRVVHNEYREHFTKVPDSYRNAMGRELKATRKDGAEFPVQISLNNIPTPQGTYVLSVVEDITERKHTAEELQAQREELLRSNRDLEQFAYIASHDLQEPLRMVASYTELLSERYQGQLDEKADKYIRYAVDGARRMQQLVADILAYSRVGSQGRPLVRVDASAIADRVIGSMRATIEAQGACVERTELPFVLADESQLSQLFQNLISNSIKFRSEQPPRVHISARLQGVQVEFVVSDNGIGIEPQYAERIFGMFQRLHERGKYEGTGIGLAVAQRIVERHGGRIWVESELGKGAAIHFTLQTTKGVR